jgi:hypothetical protein
VQESTEGQLDAPDPRKDTSLTDQARRGTNGCPRPDWLINVCSSGLRV